jgi:hypothetical protein
MADDIKAENYKKSVQKLADEWSKDVGPLFKQLVQIAADLDKLKLPDDKKQIDELTKKRTEIGKKIDSATLGFNTSLNIIQDPVKAEESELKKLPPWFKEIIKRKGIPLSEHWTLKPDLDIDIKKKKVNSAGVILEWDW